MAHQYVAVRALHRSAQVRVVDKDGNNVKLSPTVDTVIDLDLGSNRQALEHHASVGQWIITAAHGDIHSTTLPANS